MKITQNVALNLEDTTSNPIEYFRGSEGETLFMGKAEFIQFLEHPQVVGMVKKFKVVMGNMNIRVGEDL